MMRFATFATLLLSSAIASAYEVGFDADLYLAGSARYLDSDFEPAEDDFEAVNNASHLGLGGRFRSGDLSAFVRISGGEKNAKAGIEALRELYAGVDSPYGQLMLGRGASMYRTSGEQLDPFYDTSIAGFNGREATEGAGYGLSNLSNGYSKQMVSYTTPAIAGLRLNVAGYFGEEDAPNDETDMGYGAEYKVQGMAADKDLIIGVQYLDIRNPVSFAAGNEDRNEMLAVGGSPGKSESYRVHGSYRSGAFSVGASFEHVDVAAEPEPRGYLLVSSSYALGDKTRLAASYGMLDFETGSPALSGNGYSLGVFHNLGYGVKSYLAARWVELDSAGEAATVAFGLSYSFRRKKSWGA